MQNYFKKGILNSQTPRRANSSLECPTKAIPDTRFDIHQISDLILEGMFDKLETTKFILETTFDVLDVKFDILTWILSSKF